MPQKTQGIEFHIPKFVPTIPTCFEIVTDTQFEVYHNFFDKATIHLTHGKEIPVERSKRLRLFLQDEKVIRAVIPQNFYPFLGPTATRLAKEKTGTNIK